MNIKNICLMAVSIIIPDKSLRKKFRNKYKTAKQKNQGAIMHPELPDMVGDAICLSLLKNNIAPKFSSGDDIWDYVDSKKHIESVYRVYLERFEILFEDRFRFFSENNPDNKTDLILIHGNNKPIDIQKHFIKSSEYNVPIVLTEDGFILSIQSPSYFNNAKEFRAACSVMLDSVAPYYDATSVTSIESELNSDHVYSKDELNRAKHLINEIVKNKISKYNNQPVINEFGIRKSNKTVLVVDQACNDWSIKKGYADERTFIEMLDAAIAENPDAHIIVKVHPDMIADSNRGGVKNKHLGHFTDYKVKESDKNRVEFLATYVNPFSVIEVSDKVYVCSSQFGFEALMAGKEVHIWGSPYYAGWGLGIQRKTSPAIDRRSKKHTLEEVFVSAYINFSRYINPLTYEKCELEDLLRAMVILREKYFLNDSYCKTDFKSFQEPVLKEEIPIVFAFDDDDIDAAIVAISSLLKSDKDNKYYLYCLSEKTLQSDTVLKIKDTAQSYPNMAGIKFIRPKDNDLSHNYKNSKINRTSLLKFEIHKIIKDRPRVFYSDINILFLKGLSSAWLDSSSHDFIIAACLDLSQSYGNMNKNRKEVWDKYFEFRFGQYITSNLMILNLDKIKKSNIDERLSGYLKDYEQLNDADILFLCCNPAIYYLSSRFAISSEFNITDTNHRGFIKRFRPAEDLVLMEKFPVAKIYTKSIKPWQSKNSSQYYEWMGFVKENT